MLRANIDSHRFGRIAMNVHLLSENMIRRPGRETLPVVIFALEGHLCRSEDE